MYGTVHFKTIVSVKASLLIDQSILPINPSYHFYTFGIINKHGKACKRGTASEVIMRPEAGHCCPVPAASA